MLENIVNNYIVKLNRFLYEKKKEKSFGYKYVIIINIY